MTTKFSAFANVSELSNTEELVGLAVGDNARVTKQELLKGATGENIVLMASSTQFAALSTDSGLAVVVADDGGIAQMNGDNGSSITNNALGARVECEGGGNVHIEVADGLGVLILNASGTYRIELATGGVVSNFVSPDGFKISYYQNGNPSWATDPARYDEAIERLADAVAGLLGFPVP